MYTGRLIKGANGATFPPTDVVAREAAKQLARVEWYECRPRKCKSLVESVWAALGWQPDCYESGRQSEEHLRYCAADAAHGLDYLGEARLRSEYHQNVGLVFLSEWVEKHQPPLINTGFEDSGRFKIDLCVRAGTNAAMRAPYISDKYNRSAETIAKQLNFGSIVEEHVSDRFRATWPTLWRPATNAGQYERPSRDDFRMKIPSRQPLTFNVKARVDPHGVYRRMSDAPPADVYLIGYAEDDSWYLSGWCDADEFSRGVRVETARSLDKLGAWLNCVVDGVDYAAMQSSRRVYRPSYRPPYRRRSA